MIVKCDYCGKEFKKSPSRVTKLNFDCKACYVAYCDENRKTNKIEVNGNETKVFFFNGGYFVIDTEKYDKIRQYCWVKIKQKGVEYAITRVNNKNIYLHRFITDCPDNKVIDHIDRNGLNNKMENLKICTIFENNQNRKNINIAGINFRKDTNKWRARLRKGKKDILNKCFDTIEEAIQARKQALEGLYA